MADFFEELRKKTDAKLRQKIVEQGRPAGEVLPPTGKVTYGPGGETLVDGRPYDPGQASRQPTFKRRDAAGNVQDIRMGVGAPTMIAASRDPTSDVARSFMVGRDPEGAAKERARAGALEALAAGRAAPVVDRAKETAARNMITSAMGGFQSQLQGTGPTMALAQGQRGMDAAAAAQMGAMGARPGSAAAQRAALLGGGRMANVGAQQAAGTRLAELGAATQGYGGAAIGRLGGDTSSALKRADIGLDQRQLNDALAAFYAGQGIDMGALQMGAGKSALDFRQGLTDTWNANLTGEAELEQQQRDAKLLTAIEGLKGTFTAGGSWLT